MPLGGKGSLAMKRFHKTMRSRHGGIPYTHARAGYTGPVRGPSRKKKLPAKVAVKGRGVAVKRKPAKKVAKRKISALR